MPVNELKYPCGHSNFAKILRLTPLYHLNLAIVFHSEIE
jgi:hypothetical protein